MVSSGTKVSDFAGFISIKAKKHLERCFLTNGAACCAIIGLITMRILRD